MNSLQAAIAASVVSVVFLWSCAKCGFADGVQNHERRAPSWSHIPWRSFHGATGLLGTDVLWGFGALEVWDTTGEVEANLDFHPEGRIVKAGSADDLFGVRFIWPKNVEAGFAYRWSLGFESEEELPDTMSINGNVVWRRSQYAGRSWPHLAGHDWKDTALLVAEYIPNSDEEPVVVVAKRGGAMRFAPPIIVHRRALEPGEAAPDYKHFDLPGDVRIYKRPADETAHLLEEFALTADTAPLEPLEGPLHGPVIWISDLFSAKPVYADWSYTGDDLSSPTAIAAMRKLTRYYTAAGMRGASLPFVGFIQRDELSREGLDALAQAGASRFWAHATTVPEEHGSAWMKGFREHNIAYLNKFAEAHPDAELWVGFYEVDQRQMGWLTFPEYERYGSAGTYERNLFLWRKNSEDREEFLTAAGVLGRARTFFQASGAACPMDYFYRAGADVAFCKNIMRQNVQIVVANGRGAGRAMKKSYGFDMDLWHSQYWTSWHPEELRDILMTYFFGGMEQHFYEMLLFTRELEPSVLGAAVLKTYRLMQEHPLLGESIVPIGVLRGPRETWQHCYARTTGWWWSATNNPPRDENWDYDLLNVFFDEFGLHWRTDMKHLCTGTPYGPVDFVPADAPLDHLRTFKLLVFMGPGGLTERALANLAAYVEAGGTLITTVHQLEILAVGRPGTVPAEMFGCTVGPIRTIELRERTNIDRAFSQRKLGDGWFEFRCIRDGDAAAMSALREELAATAPPSVEYYELSGSAGEVLERLPNGEPMLVRLHVGKGTVYLWSTKRMLDGGWDIAEPLLRREAAEAAALGIHGDPSWLEYGFRRVPGGVVIYFLHHGQAGYPSGKGADRGPWRGTVELKPRILGLSADNLTFWHVERDYSLSQAHAERDPRGFRLALEVDRWQEILVNEGATPAWP